LSEEAASRPVEACSACTGDYEDPDRTAWQPDDLEDADAGNVCGTSAEEFIPEE
jgi:hypothetical protein